MMAAQVTEIWGRALSPELVGEGWLIGFDSMFWKHLPSLRWVYVQGCRRNHRKRIPVWSTEPIDPNASGYIVGCELRDHRVAPIQTTEFWIATYDEAVRLARSIRASILAECAPEPYIEQLAFDYAGGCGHG